MNGILSALCLAAAIGMTVGVSTATAGPNAGGALLVHALEDVAYTTDNDGYCGPLSDAGLGWVDRCEDVVATLPDPVRPAVWVVYAAFSESNTPVLAGVEFGISYDPGLSLLEWGSCADLESPMSSWPESGSGTIVVWNEERTDRLVAAYWFAGYSYSATGGLTFEVGPHPENGGHFADRSPAPILDQIARYGSLGFGTEGSVPCPEVGRYLIRPDGSGDFPTIQDALSVAAPGSVIELADGVYSGDGNRDLAFNFTPFDLGSVSGDPARCVIDCGGTPEENHRGILFDPEARPSSISGITIRNGYAGPQLGLGPQRQGGAIRVNGGELIISDCVFESCGTERSGGAVAGSANPLVITRSVFIDNWADGGAGGALDVGGGADVRLSGCRFEGNRARGILNGREDGGALRVVLGSLLAEDCLFSANQARRGGAIHTLRSEVLLDRCVLAGNVAGSGGAMYVRQSEVEVRNGTLSDNSARLGSGIFCDYFPGSLGLSSSIVAFGLVGEAIVCGDAEVSLDNVDIFGNAGGDWTGCLTEFEDRDGNLSLDPLFCDRGNQDFGLDRVSPCATSATVFRPGVIGARGVSCGDRAGEPGLVSPVAGRDQTLARDHGIGSPLPDVSGSSGVGPQIVRVRPNPVSAATFVEYAVPRDGRVHVAVHDAGGRLVRILVDGDMRAAGLHTAVWDGRGDAGSRIPIGAYFVRLVASGGSVSSRISVVR